MTINMEKSDRNELILDSLRIAIVQFPYIPIICDNDFNSLYEPDGGMNYWWFAKPFKDGENFNDLDLKKKYEDLIKKTFTDDYLLWLELTLKQVFEYIIHENDVDIIVFPEYSLPVEIDNKIKQMLIDFSKKTCIIAGIGSVTLENGNLKKNRVVVANNGELTYCEKIHPTNKETNLLGIVGGEGPIIHELKLKRLKNDSVLHFPFAVLNCRDNLERIQGGDPIQTIVIKELAEKKLTPADIKLYVVPSFSISTTDFESLSKMDAKRGSRVIAFVNWGPFGGSRIWWPTASNNEPDSTEKLGRNVTGYTLVDIPFTYEGISKKIKIINDSDIQKITHKSGIFKFDGEICNFGEIQLETQSLYQLISKRLDIAIDVCGICIKRSQINYEDNILKNLKKWKSLQSMIHQNFLGNGPGFINYTEPDHVTLFKLNKNENIYLFVLRKLKDRLPDQLEEEKKKVSDLIEFVKDRFFSDSSYW